MGGNDVPRFYSLIALFLFVCLPSAALSQAPADEPDDLRLLRQDFDRIEQLPTDRQRKALPRLYREMYPRFHSYHAAETNGFSLTRRGLTLKDRGLKVFERHRETLVALVRDDFRSDENAALERALWIVGDMKMSEFFNEVAGVFKRKKGGELAEWAAYTLRDLNDPRASRLLAEAFDPKRPGLYMEQLRNLCVDRPADPALVKQLHADDPEVRWSAAYALGGSGDDRLAPHIERLLEDREARVRAAAVIMAFNLKKHAFADMRRGLVVRLADEDAKVRAEAAECFAWHKDPVCARALLDLLQDPALDRTTHSRVVQAIHTLTSSYFGYHVGSDAWEPTTKNNKAAIARFAEWVAKQQPTKRP
jgi:HEAT repeat protein